MENNITADSKPKMTLKDFISYLKGIERILETGSDSQHLAFIREFTSILQPYSNLETNEFLDSLKNGLTSKKVKDNHTVRYRVFLKQIQGLSLVELKQLVERDTLNRELLLLVADKKLGLSKGTLSKVSKERIREQIEDAIQNIETLESIRKKAGE